MLLLQFLLAAGKSTVESARRIAFHSRKSRAGRRLQVSAWFAYTADFSLSNRLGWKQELERVSN